MAPPDSKKTDPGWNDPPMLIYNASNPPPKSRIANKRISFPLTQNPSAAASSCSGVSNEEKFSEFNSDAVLNQVLLHIDTTLKNCNSDNNINEQIQTLKIMWSENKLSNKLKTSVLQMAQHIVNGNKEKANECRLQIMMENAAACDPWILAFKQLIFQK